MHHLLLLAALVAAPADVPPVTALAYSPNGRTLLAGLNRQVVIIDINSADVARRLDLPGPVTAIAVLPDGKSFAVTTGQPSQSGDIHIFPLPAKESPRVIKSHRDLVYGLAASSDGKQLATGSYDRLVKLWNIADGQEQLTLKDHSDSVTAVAFQPNGPLLASVAADRTVKIWDTKTGKRLYTLSDSTDALSTVAFSPDGNRLAAAGADKSIRVWEVNANEGKLLGSFFAHDGAVLQIAFTPDSKSLISLGRDRIVKVWNAGDFKEQRYFGPLSAEPFVMALRPDGKQLAIGRQDGVLTLHDISSGKVTATPLPEKPKPPILDAVAPNGAQRGLKLQVKFTGERLDFVDELIADNPAVKIKKLSSTQKTIDAEIELGDSLEAGFVSLSAKSQAGESKAIRFAVDLFPLGQPPTVSSDKLKLNQTYAVDLARPGAVHEFAMSLSKGQEVGVIASISPESKVDPVMEWVDQKGAIRATGTSTLAIRNSEDTSGTLRIRDRDYRGGKAFGYRLHVGEIPIIQAVYPLGGQRGTTTEFELFGVHLPSARVIVDIPEASATNKKLPLPLPGVSNKPMIVAGEFPEIQDSSATLPVPGLANGRISQGRQTWRFFAKKGQPLVVEALAQRHGSPLDPQLEICDAKGQPVERARLQCVAKTVMTLRDHPANSANIRLENWNEFAVDDYVWMGQELCRISELPGHPDADCDFYAVGGKRQTFLGTTPGWQPIGATVYKVQINKPNTTLAANGFPVIPLYYRNDDGGPGYGKDARLIFDPPADGEYQVIVTDARGQSGPHHAYRLTVRPPKPDFEVKATPLDPVVETNGSRAINVNIDRLDGFEGPVTLGVENLPDGFTCPPTIVEAGQMRATLCLSMMDAPRSPVKDPITLVSSAQVNSQLFVHATKLGIPRPVGLGDIVTKVEQPSITLKPGQETHFQVRIERRNGFTGRVPMEVKNLPHGVRVMHIGLNGIMITEKETTRTIVLGSEPWVGEAMTPISVVSKREDTNSEHGSPPIMLHIKR